MGNSRASLVKKENFGIQNKNKKNDDNYDVDDDDDIVNELVEEDEEEEKEEEEGPECSICLGEYEKGDALVSLNPCRHVFHEACISAWTNQNTRCPLCNIDLVNDLLPPPVPQVVQEQQQQQQQHTTNDHSYS